jgi:hypothetical protein
MALEDPVMLDKIRVTRLVPRTCARTAGKRSRLRRRFSSRARHALSNRFWGYGPHDANGFRWHREYNCGKAKFPVLKNAARTHRE